MKKEHLFAVAIAAFAFFACSDDNNKSSDTGGSGNGGGCLFKVEGIEQYTCIEENQYYSKQSCVAPTGEWADSGCPSGGSKCEQDAGGYKTVTHYYNYPIDPCTGSLPNSSSGPGSTPSSSSTPGSTPSSSSVSETYGACHLAYKNLVYDDGWEICMESITLSECEEIREVEAKYGTTVDFIDSCPEGYIRSCEVKEDGIVHYSRYYDEYFEDWTCEELLELFDED